jgi:hypothetical protein
MRVLKLLLTSIALSLPAVLPAQTAAAPAYYQIINHVKVTPGKSAEYADFVRETSMKTAQKRVDSGEIYSWTLLRTVMPAGKEARADYMISVLSEGPPRGPQSREDQEKSLKAAGVKMTVAEVFAKRDTLSSLVSTEMWRPQLRVGSLQKGHYLYINYMKVHDAAGYTAFETNTWRPMAEQWTKDGAMSGWMYSTKSLPSGTEMPYGAYSADFFPSWEAVFKSRSAQETFAKVHPGKKYEDAQKEIPKLRDLARRELWVVVERIVKK